MWWDTGTMPLLHSLHLPTLCSSQYPNPNPKSPPLSSPHLPLLLRFRPSRRQKIQYLKTLGVDTSSSSSSSLETLDWILCIVDYLKSKGFSDSHFPRLSFLCPRIFSLSGVMDSQIYGGSVTILFYFLLISAAGVPYALSSSASGQINSNSILVPRSVQEVVHGCDHRDRGGRRRVAAARASAVADLLDVPAAEEGEGGKGGRSGGEVGGDGDDVVVQGGDGGSGRDGGGGEEPAAVRGKGRGLQLRPGGFAAGVRGGAGKGERGDVVQGGAGGGDDGGGEAAQGRGGHQAGVRAPHGNPGQGGPPQSITASCLLLFQGREAPRLRLPARRQPLLPPPRSVHSLLSLSVSKYLKSN